MNDNLKPKLLWIEGRCYRTNDNTTDIAGMQEHVLYENDAPYDEMDEADDDSAYEIVMVDSNRYVSKIHIPDFRNMLFRFKKKNLRREIRKDMILRAMEEMSK